MFKYSDEKLIELGAIHTTREIEQQPQLWQELLDAYAAQKADIDAYLGKITQKHGRVKVIFAGAGTSAFVGETIIPYLGKKVDKRKWELTSIATTDIISNPEEFLLDIPTLLVSFARSGNSPESAATVALGKKLVKDFYQLTITCAPEGKLAVATRDDENNYLFLMPALSNDKGFAMTSSFTCMTLAALLALDEASFEEKKAYVQTMIAMAGDILAREDEIQKIIDLDFNRIVYLGSGSLGKLTREATLKILELTAGKVATLYDTSLGFRHGPKSFLDENTLIFTFSSNDDYARKYDMDMLNEMQSDGIAKGIYNITTAGKSKFAGEEFVFKPTELDLPEGYLALAFVIFAQIVSVMASLKVDIKPDTPSESGTVNRVVQGVIIHDF